MGIDWNMTRIPKSLKDVLEEKKENESEGIWKPVARDLLEKDPELEKEIKRKDPEVAKELGLETCEGLFSGEKDDSFSVFD